MSANDTQVGGRHYKDKAIQPWDFIAVNGIPYLEGCAIKYLSRWRDKGGLADLEKAKHYIDKVIELEMVRIKEEAPVTVKHLNPGTLQPPADDCRQQFSNLRAPFRAYKENE